MEKLYTLILIVVSIAKTVFAQEVAVNVSPFLQTGKECSGLGTHFMSLPFDEQVPCSSLSMAIAHKDAVKKLELSGKNLTTFPAEILSMHNLEYLDLSNNKLTDLPESLGTLTNLKILALNGNQLTSLPASIGDLKNLEILLIQDNKNDFVLSPSLAKLKNLKRIWVSHLAEVPPFLWEMNSLENVRLWYCNLTAVPSSVKNLIHLKEVCFKGNQLNSLPDDLFALPELTYLNVGENKFAYLPESLNKLSKLDYLGIFSNPIKELKLDDNMLKHVRFIAAWNTELAPDFKNSIEKNSTITKVNQSGNGLH